MTARALRFLALRFLAATLVCSAGASAQAPPDLHPNPPLRCADLPLAEPGEGYPHPVRQYPHEPPAPRPVAALEGFCDAVEERFAASHLTTGEADTLFAALDSLLTIRDASFGMPSPDEPAPPPVVLRERVALHAAGPGVVELYYWYAGCGMNYVLARAVRGDDGALVVEPVERWSASAPC